MPKTLTIAFTSSISAPVEVDLSGYGIAPIYKIVKAQKFIGSDATNPAKASNLTLVNDGYLTSASPASGEIALCDKKKVKLGDSVDDKTILILTVVTYDEVGLI